MYQATLGRIGQKRGEEWFQNQLRLYQAYPKIPPVLYDWGKTNDKVAQLLFLWRANDLRDQEATRQVASDIIRSSDWMLLASLVGNSTVGEGILDEVAQQYAQVPGFEYLSRVIVKHPLVNMRTLKFLLSAPRLALDPGVDQQYRDYIQKKLRQKNAS